MSKKIELGTGGTMCFLKSLTDAQSSSYLMANQLAKQLAKKDYQFTELYQQIISVVEALDTIEKSFTACLILNVPASNQVGRPVDEEPDIRTWDKAETKLIIDPLFNGYQFALVDHKNELIAKGKTDGNLSTLISFLDVKKENVYVDIGGTGASKTLKLCAKNGYTAIKGSSSGRIQKMKLDGCVGYLIDPKEPPFCFLFLN
jgi:hypothetical protein